MGATQSADANDPPMQKLHRAVGQRVCVPLAVELVKYASQAMSAEVRHFTIWNGTSEFMKLADVACVYGPLDANILAAKTRSSRPRPRLGPPTPAKGASTPSQFDSRVVVCSVAEYS